MYSDIEFSCSGNNGRSVIAQYAALQFANELGAADLLNISSSGTLVNVTRSKEEVFRSISNNLEVAVQLGILSKRGLSMAEANPWEVHRRFVEYEKSQRTRFIRDILEMDDSTQKYKQTSKRPEAQLILPVSASNVRRTNEIYGRKEGTIHCGLPRIVRLGEFTQIECGEDTPIWIRTYGSFVAYQNKVVKAAMKSVLLALRA